LFFLFLLSKTESERTSCRMNLSLDTILTNARELVSRLRRDDSTADTAVNQAQYVQERILSMKQVIFIIDEFLFLANRIIFSF